MSERTLRQGTSQWTARSRIVIVTIGIAAMVELAAMVVFIGRFLF
jgi:hypothetical protein